MNKEILRELQGHIELDSFRGIIQAVFYPYETSLYKTLPEVRRRVRSDRGYEHALELLIAQIKETSISCSEAQPLSLNKAEGIDLLFLLGNGYMMIRLSFAEDVIVATIISGRAHFQDVPGLYIRCGYGMNINDALGEACGKPYKKISFEACMLPE